MKNRGGGSGLLFIFSQKDAWRLGSMVAWKFVI
jgi:hypothetical protein